MLEREHLHLAWTAVTSAVKQLKRRSLPDPSVLWRVLRLLRFQYVAFPAFEQLAEVFVAALVERAVEPVARAPVLLVVTENRTFVVIVPHEGRVKAAVKITDVVSFSG